MSTTSQDLAKADQQVAFAQRHVSAQQEVIAMMRAAGASTAGAEHLLAQFEATLRRQRDVRTRMASKPAPAKAA